MGAENKEKVINDKFQREEKHKCNNERSTDISVVQNFTKLRRDTSINDKDDNSNISISTNQNKTKKASTTGAHKPSTSKKEKIETNSISTNGIHVDAEVPKHKLKDKESSIGKEDDNDKITSLQQKLHD